MACRNESETSYYYDDPDEGLSRATSHPDFNAQAPNLFFEQDNPFAPFGSDTGFDALSELQDWFQERGHLLSGEELDLALLDFFVDMITAWGYEYGEEDLSTAAKVKAFVKQDEENREFVIVTSQAAIAVALGQLKIMGSISPTILSEGKDGVHMLTVLAKLSGNTEALTALKTQSGLLASVSILQ